MEASAFSTIGQPEERCAGHFRRSMADSFSIGLTIAPAIGSDRLDSTVQGFNSVHIGAAALRFSPHRIQPAASGSGTDRLLLSLLKEGHAMVAQDGREAFLKPGDIFLIDPTRPFEASSSEILAHSLYLRSAGLRAILPRLENFTARRFGTQTGLGMVLAKLIDELVESGGSLNDAAIEIISQSVPPLLAAFMLGGVSCNDVMGGKRLLSQLHRVRSFVREHLSDPALKPEIIARGVRVSERALHDLFAGEERSLMKMVWHERLERCRAELSNPLLKRRSISEIALGWGFSDMGHFSRSFRRAYGCCPSAFRREISIN